jgi:hypothetical protein
MGDAFIGRGWRFPLLPDAAGRLAYVEGEANVAQSLELLLLTRLRERHMRPRFGSAVHDLVMAPGSPTYLRQLEETVERAVVEWEPRVELESVDASQDAVDPTRVDVAISYRIRRTNTRVNLVFPYYLEEGG